MNVLRVTKKVLESAGHEVLAADSPKRARELVATDGRRIYAIITDVVMPEMDGPALVRKLTQQLGPLPVLYVSGYMPEEVGHDLELGVNCLQKPVEARRLLQYVAELLEARERSAHKERGGAPADSLP